MQRKPAEDMTLDTANALVPYGKPTAKAPSKSDAARSAEALALETGLVAKTLEKLATERVKDLERLKRISEVLRGGQDAKLAHRQLLLLAQSSREAYASLQESRDILLGVYRESSHGEDLAVDEDSGLPNGIAFRARLDALFNSEESRTGLVLMLVEMGGLHMVTAETGATIAGRVVRRFGGILKKSVKRHDFIARISPQYFAMLFVDITTEHAAKIGLRIHDAVESKLSPDGDPLLDMVSVTMGIAGLTEEMKTVDDLLTEAQNSLHMARREGGPRIYVA